MVQRSERLYFLALFLCVSVFILLMAGGAVTSHEAGLAVPDWPLSYGMFFPPMVGNIFWEHGHRMIAGFVALLTLLTAVLVQKREPRPWLRRLAWISFAVVILQALLGGMTVLMLLPPPVSIAHACLGQTFFCLTIALAYYLSPASGRSHFSEDAGVRKLRRLSLITFVLIYLQLILGAVVRHTGHLHAVITHIVVAFLIVIHVVLLMARIWRFFGDIKFLYATILVTGFLTAIQIFLGMGSFIYTHMLERGHTPPLGEVLFTVAHQSTGAMILGLIFFVTIVAFPTPRETPAEA